MGVHYFVVFHSTVFEKSRKGGLNKQTPVILPPKEAADTI